MADRKEELNKLFDKISNDPFYENDILTNNENNNDNNNDSNNDEANNIKHQENQHLFVEEQDLDWLYEHSSDEDDTTDAVSHATTSNLTALATGFLEQDQTEQLEQALNSTDHTQENATYYRFFSKRCKLQKPILQDEALTITDSLAKSRYKYVVKCSKNPSKQKYLLSSGLLPIWYQLGWNCPHSILEWLIQIVAFDKDSLTAKQAMTIIFSLWSNLFNEALPLNPSTPNNTNVNRNMSIETFTHILNSYGALELPTILTSANEFDVYISQQNDSVDTLVDKIPLVQFQWVLQLLTRSLVLWPHAYTLPQLVYLAKVLLYLGADCIGVLLLKYLQDAVSACLNAMSDWKPCVQQVAFSVCQRLSLVELQVRLARVTKSTCPRSTYLRRVIATIGLEIALMKGKVTVASSRGMTFDMVSSSLAIDSDILPRLIVMVNDASSIFQESEPDYRTLCNSICLLDYAIGTNVEELSSSTVR
ncbi:hypothetical protein BC941DRAFT_12786 [Chlamydoabsidia padenii]|nr:hypothetical protein BC941DRAFT_12786 [Chlamydoabsidia padenii]